MSYVGQVLIIHPWVRGSEAPQASSNLEMCMNGLSVLAIISAPIKLSKISSIGQSLTLIRCDLDRHSFFFEF